MRKIFLVLFCVILISCSDNSTKSSYDPDKISTPEITQIDQDAFELLYNSANFASAAVGFAGSPPEQVRAFQTLLESEEAEYLFQKLQTDARIEGQLYGLCGLYLVNKEQFDSVVPAYSQSEVKVNTFVGCVLSLQPVKDVIPAIADGGWPESYRDCQL